jgi:hypothetical protein
MVVSTTERLMGPKGKVPAMLASMLKKKIRAGDGSI